MEFFYLILGLLTLFISGNFLVKSGVELANQAKISKLVVGLTVVAFGTSAPELFVSLMAALKGHPEIAMGNIVGSNIANIALVLALTVIVLPIAVQKNSLKFDFPMMFLASMLLFIFILDDNLVFLEGAIFIIILVFFIFYSVYKSRKELKESKATFEKPTMSVLEAVFLLILSSIGLYVGVEWMIDDGAVPIAKMFGLSEKAISVSLIAFGTSIPEFTASLIAAFKKETDISLGNIIGSNIFNIFAVLGTTSMVKSISLDHNVFLLDFIVMFLVSIILFISMLHLKTDKITRFSGIILFLIYVVYMYFVIFGFPIELKI